ncbi:MAG: hypothetical protein ACM3UU_07050 [Ignavibacteriales bacterium]
MNYLYILLATIFILYLVIKMFLRFREFNKRTINNGKYEEIHDLKEDNPELKLIIDKAGEEAENILEEEGISVERGYCHKYWTLKKKILKEKYNLDWKSPKEMNPLMRYD